MQLVVPGRTFVRQGDLKKVHTKLKSATCANVHFSLISN
jgi:hypothetical protein